jgi:Mn2+/Fe2+ NRAMP family transporter
LLVLSNDKKILGDRVNSALGNTIAIVVAVSTIALGAWTGYVTLTGG